MRRNCIALILAGGEGNRMARTRPHTPKPLVEVAGKTLIDMLLQQLWNAQIDEVHVAIRSGARKIMDHLRRLSVTARKEILFIVEEVPLGTIGALGELKDRAETVLVMNGDLLSAIDLSAVLNRHENSGADFTIATHFQHSRLELGEVRVDQEMRVIDYLEKPVKRYRISSGVYVIGRAVLALLDETSWKPLPELVHEAIKSGCKVLAYQHEAAWIDVNNESDLLEAQKLYGSDPTAFRLVVERLSPDREMTGEL